MVFNSDDFLTDFLNMAARSVLMWAHVFVLLLLLATGGTLLADGKMYAEKVNTQIPYQRALIVFDEGKQTMVLQSQYQIPGEPGKHTLGWVVPVPAVPEISTMDADGADWLFNGLDRLTLPDYIRGWPLIAILMLVALVSGLGLLFASFSRRFSQRRGRMRMHAFLSIALAITLFFYLPYLVRLTKGAGGVEVLRSGKAGIYDTQVVRAESADDLIAWFNAKSFRFDNKDEKAIQSYIDRKWCFVTAAVDASIAPNNSTAVSNQLLAPLILHFPTTTPVYPTALTATGGHPTEILIYLASREPMKTTSDLKLKFSGGAGRNFMPLLSFDLEGNPEVLDWFNLIFQGQIHLSKFKATLMPEQMARDIEFLPDPEAKPSRELVFKW
jgi:hypothetical protein